MCLTGQVGFVGCVSVRSARLLHLWRFTVFEGCWVKGIRGWRGREVSGDVVAVDICGRSGMLTKEVSRASGLFHIHK